MSQQHFQNDLQAYFQFLMEVVLLIAQGKDDAKVIYPLLSANTDKLNNNLANILRNWSTSTLEELPVNSVDIIAANIGNFGNRIQQFPLGNKASNIEIAIACYEIVLRVYTRKAFPEDWAQTQNNLGGAYYERVVGDRADNIENTINAYQAALEVRTYEYFPQDWAMTQNNLGNAYRERIKGNKHDNIEEAIKAYKAALQVYTYQTFPQYWATTQNNLGNAYGDRINGNKAVNIELAI